MNIDEAKAYIEQHGTELLEPDNSSKHKARGAKGYGYICPICGSGSGPKGTGITENPKSPNHFTCWAGCFKNASILDVISKRDGYDTQDYITQLRHICGLFNIKLDGVRSKQDPREDFAPDTTTEDSQRAPRAPILKGEADYFEDIAEWHNHIRECDYLLKRGISYETQERFWCGYCAEWKHPNIDPKKAQYVPASPRVILPNGGTCYLARDIRDNLTDEQKKYAKQKVGGSKLYNTSALYGEGTKVVFIVEGEIDALSIEELGFSALALGSTTNKDQLIHELKKAHFESMGLTLGEASRQIEEAEKLNQKLKLNLGESFPKLILALDNDTRGDICARDLSVQLEELGVKYLAPMASELYGSSKDANDALLADREAFKKKLTHFATKTDEELYDENSAKPLLDEFLQDFKTNNNPKPISTGFFNLNDELDGGLFEGLYFIGAISSLGKTTLALQIADNIAKEGRDVLIFSLEMSKRELLAKSLSRLTIQTLDNYSDLYSKARSVRDLTTFSEKNNTNQHAIIQEAVATYSKIAERVFILEGLGDVDVYRVRSAVAEHIRQRKQTPVVFIDYLQILAPYDDRATDKQNTDKAVLELKRISRDFKLPVIAISSLNRANYNEPISMLAFKESGAIEYSSDVLLGLQLKGAGTKNFDVDEAKRRFPREIELKVLKNRNGQTGGVIGLQFYAKYNYFEED